MLQKNINKQKRKERKTWTGFYVRKTPTKAELQKKLDRKHKAKLPV